MHFRLLDVRLMESVRCLGVLGMFFLGGLRCAFGWGVGCGLVLGSGVGRQLDWCWLSCGSVGLWASLGSFLLLACPWGPWIFGLGGCLVEQVPASRAD